MRRIRDVEKGQDDLFQQPASVLFRKQIYIFVREFSWLARRGDEEQYRYCEEPQRRQA